MLLNLRDTGEHPYKNHHRCVLVDWKSYTCNGFPEYKVLFAFDKSEHKSHHLYGYLHDLTLSNKWFDNNKRSLLSIESVGFPVYSPIDFDNQEDLDDMMYCAADALKFNLEPVDLSVKLHLKAIADDEPPFKNRLDPKYVLENNELYHIGYSPDNQAIIIIAIRQSNKKWSEIIFTMVELINNSMLSVLKDTFNYSETLPEQIKQKYPNFAWSETGIYRWKPGSVWKIIGYHLDDPEHAIFTHRP